MILFLHQRFYLSRLAAKKKCFQVKEEILAFMINYIYIYILASYFDSSMCLVDTASVVMCPENNRE